MKSYSNNATSYYLWNENIEARDDFTFTDKDFIAMLKTYDEVVICEICESKVLLENAHMNEDGMWLCDECSINKQLLWQK